MCEICDKMNRERADALFEETAKRIVNNLNQVSPLKEKSIINFWGQLWPGVEVQIQDEEDGEI